MSIISLCQRFSRLCTKPQNFPVAFKAFNGPKKGLCPPLGKDSSYLTFENNMSVRSLTCFMGAHKYINPTGSLNILQQFRNMTLNQMHRKGKKKKLIRRREQLGLLQGSPFKRAVVLKTIIKKPKKPNSANRKCVRIRLSTGVETVAYIPGIGHNLQEHNIVLVRGGRLQDVPGVKLVCVRGKYDLAHVQKVKK